MKIIIKDGFGSYKGQVMSIRQFGSRQRSSCVTCLTSLHGRVMDAIQDKEDWVACVYLEFVKSFERVTFNFLSKLKITREMH